MLAIKAHHKSGKEIKCSCDNLAGAPKRSVNNKTVREYQLPLKLLGPCNKDWICSRLYKAFYSKILKHRGPANKVHNNTKFYRLLKWIRTLYSFLCYGTARLGILNFTLGNRFRGLKKLRDEYTFL